MKKYPTSAQIADFPHKQSNKRFWLIASGVAGVVAITGIISMLHYLNNGQDEVISTVMSHGVRYELHAQVSWDNYCTPLTYVKVGSRNAVVAKLTDTNTGGPCPQQRDSNDWLQVGDYNKDGKMDFKVVLNDTVNTQYDYRTYLYSQRLQSYMPEK